MKDFFAKVITGDWEMNDPEKFKEVLKYRRLGYGEDEIVTLILNSKKCL